MSNIKKIILLFLTCFFSCFLLSCEDKFQEMEANYYASRYLEAMRSSVEGLKNEDTKQKTTTFLVKYGKKMTEKALEEAFLFDTPPDEDTRILYLKEYIYQLDQLMLIDAPIKDLKDLKKKAQEKSESDMNRYLESNYKLGLIQIGNKSYKKAAEHFKRIKKYSPNYKETELLLERSNKNAQKKLSVQPFYSTADPITKWISGDKKKKETKLIFQGRNVTDALTREVVHQLNKERSEYLTVQIDSEKNAEKNYHLDALIYLYEDDDTQIPLTEAKSAVLKYSYSSGSYLHWTNSTFEYELHTISYKVKLECHIKLFSPNKKELLDEFTVKKEQVKTSAYKSQPLNLPIGYQDLELPLEYTRIPDTPNIIQKRFVIDFLIEDVAKEIRDKVLDEIDR